MTAFSPTLGELRNAVDAELTDFLAGRRAALPEAGELIVEIRRLLEAGGKRLRPAFCYWGYRAAGKPHSAAIVRSAASLELLHTFAIVHDDIMDQSSTRRGVPTSFALGGVSFALLVGDLALVLADDAIMASDFPPPALAGAFAAYSRMRQEVIAGQFLDVKMAGDPLVTEEEARRVAVLKSGRYSIQEPLAIGAALAGAPSALEDGLAGYGEPLGEAFQLRDDLLGIFGDSSRTGKPIDSDIREGKRHVLYAKTVASLSGGERDDFTRLWGAGADLGAEDIVHLRELTECSGARAATEGLLKALTATAYERLRGLPLDGDARGALEALTRESTDRQS